MAPELAYRTDGASPASDVYSLGATLFHAITGVSPPHLPVLPLDPATYRTDVPADLRLWVILMTDMNPRQRPTAGAFAMAMKASLARPANAGPGVSSYEPRAGDGFSGMLSAALGIGAVALVANALLK
jgi:serine/threonine protein kinase